MLSCEEALEQMSQALDSPLTGEEQGELEAHLACCPACRADWVIYMSKIDLMKRLPVFN